MKSYSIVSIQFEQKGTPKLSEDIRSAYMRHIPSRWRFSDLDSNRMCYKHNLAYHAGATG